MEIDPTNPVGPEPVIVEHVPSQAPDLLRMGMIVGAAILGCTFIAGAYYIKVASEPAAFVPLPETLVTDDESGVWTPPEETDNNATSTSEGDQDGNSTGGGGEGLSLYALVEKTKWEQYNLQVDWLPAKKTITLEDLPIEMLDMEYVTKAYEVGTIKNGFLQGTKLYLLYEEGMALATPGLYAINTQGAVRAASWVPDVSGLPESVADASRNLKFSKGGEAYATLDDIREMGQQRAVDIGTLPLAAVPEGKLYTYNQCFFARTPSDLVVEYVIDIPFIEESSRGAYATPNISFMRTDGVYKTGEYEIYDRVNYGCGSLCSPLKVVDRPDSDFVKTGTSGDSELFTLKNPQDALFLDLYNQPNTRAWVDTSEGKYEPLSANKYSYAEFLDMAPLLFWKDPLNRWVKFVNTQFIILAEKCKPVIYLYPEEDTEVHVEVTPNVGFTKTIPEYDNGWDVIAHPDGTVTDTKTSKKYDYLYWTGWVQSYPLIEEGWVVKQEDLLALFNHYLPLYGLRGREISDFTDYWKEDLSEAPYYAISFVDQAEIDKLSPLSIDKKVDVVTRVLMTALPLQHPIELTAPRIPPVPPRHGFTVIEWGGTVLRPE